MNSDTLQFENRLQSIEKMLAAFRRRFTEAHVYLAYHAALPMVLTPHLAYCLWENFQTDTHAQPLDIPWIAVADLLLSPLFREVGREQYEMDTDFRNYLLTQMADSPRFGSQRIQKLARFLLTYIRQELNQTRSSVQTLAQAQRWAALSYLYPEKVAQEMAAQLTQLTLDKKTEWLRMSAMSETIAPPLRQAHFESLLIYLQGMRALVRDLPAQAEATLSALSTHNNQIVVAGVMLTVPKLEESDWSIDSLVAPFPPVHRFNFKVATMVRRRRSIQIGTRWQIHTQEQQSQRFVETFDKQITLEMVHIPAGDYWMGNENQKGNYHELPRHQVSVASFYLSRFPVTQAQWRTIAQTTQVRIALEENPSGFEGDNLPVEHITWFEAIEFCERLQLQTGRPYRLPSEAEWEYACRAGTQTPFHFGEALSPELATYDASQRYQGGPKGKPSKKTTVIGTTQPANAFGLGDMHGNVWEWCADHWHDDYTSAPSDSSAQITSDRNAFRTIRGGAWTHSPNECRSAYRNGIPPENKILTIGFRVALSPTTDTLM